MEHVRVAECVILVGVPGAGKTTFYQQRFAATHRHVSKDAWPNAKDRDARQKRALEEALTEGAPVVIDNTNPTVADRAAIIAVARAHGARVSGYFFDVTTREAVARNARRSGRQRVPNVAIFTIAKRLQPPSQAEGFDELFRVSVTPDGGFTELRIKN
jgi:predicted kinase